MSVATLGKSGKTTFRDPVYSDQQIRQVTENDAALIAQWACTVANERGIRVRPRPNEQFIKAVSCLSDGVVELGRAGVISVPNGAFSDPLPTVDAAR